MGQPCELPVSLKISSINPSGYMDYKNYEILRYIGVVKGI
jgi:hypothetical protein